MEREEAKEKMLDGEQGKKTNVLSKPDGSDLQHKWRCIKAGGIRRITMSLTLIKRERSEHTPIRPTGSRGINHETKRSWTIYINSSRLLDALQTVKRWI